MFFDWVALPILIFLARICDQTIGTMRVIFIYRGNRLVASVLGFFEVMIWLVVITNVIQNMHNVVCYIAYGLGFATGNFIGISVERRMALGLWLIRIIASQGTHLVSDMKAAGYGITSVKALGNDGPVDVIYTVIKRPNLAQLVGLIKEHSPQAFYTVQEVKYAEEGIFPDTGVTGLRSFFPKYK